MAGLPDVEAAVQSVVARLAALPARTRQAYAVDRTVSCRVSDLDVTFTGRVCEQGLRELTRTPAARAQIRLSVTSDDLLALTEGRLSPGAAWGAGRLRVQASPLDLLRLRALL